MDDYFIALVATIEEDEHLRSVVEQAINLGPARQHFVANLLQSLREQHAPDPLINSLALLADAEVCAKLATLISK